MSLTNLGRFTRNSFTHKGELVEEVVVKEWELGKDLILWCMRSMDYTMIEDKRNPCIWRTYTPSTEGDVPQVMAREDVRKKFEEYWGL